MPRALRRCSKPNCRQYQPCPIRGHRSWEGRETRPLPSNWNAKKRAVRHRDGPNCGMCGRSDRPQDCDHKIPRWAGGSDDISNLWFLCHKPCHKEKGDEDRKKYKK